MNARLIAGLMLAVVISACQGETASVARRACGVLDAAICDAIVRQVSKRAATLAEQPVTVVVPFEADELYQRRGDFSVFVSFATLDSTEPVSTWTATKVQFVTGELETDWSVAKWNDALPPHLVAALRLAQGRPPASDQR